MQRQNPHLFSRIALYALLVLSLACLPVGLPLSETPTPSPSPTPSPASTATPTLTPSPTPYHTPTPYPVARVGTPVPTPLRPIGINDLKRLVPVARWGEGVASRLACSPVEPLVALGTTAGVTLYDAKNLSVVASFGDKWATSLAFSPDGSLLAVGTWDGVVQIWDLRERREVRTLEVVTDHQIQGLAFSPDGRLLASSWGDVLQIWDVATGQEQQLMRYHNTIMALRFLPPGDKIVAGTFDGGLVVWQVKDGSMLQDLTQGYTPVASLEVTSDGALLAINAGNKARLLRGSDFSTLEEYEFAAYKDVRYLTMDQKGQYIAGGSGDSLKIWERGKSEPLHSTLFPAQIGDPCFGPEGDFLALGLSDGEVVVVSIGRWERRQVQGPPGPINTLAFSPDGRFLGIGTMAGLAQLWRMDTGTPVRLPKIHEGGAVWDVAFTPDSQRFLSASGKPVLQAWSTQTGEPLESLEHEDMSAYSVAVSPDGRYLAMANNIGEVEVLLASDWRRTLYNYRHQTGVLHLAFSPTEPHLLASAGNDGLVRLADVEQRQIVRSFQHHAPVYRVAFSPDGQTLATGLGDGSIYIWSITGEQPMAAFIAHTFTVTGLAFGPDGRFLASASIGEQEVRLWDVSPSRASRVGTIPVAQGIRRPLRALEHPTLVYDVAFNPDGTLLAVSLDTGIIWLWGAP